jgi:selenocysteine lyase/cysteine desulfurase
MQAPDRYESGTMNTAGIAALGEGVKILLEEGVENIGERESRLTCQLIEAIRDLPGLTLHGPPAGKGRSEGTQRSGVVSITLKNRDSAQAAMILDNSFAIAVRSGLHCAPDAHRTLGTLDTGGTIRISPGYFTTEDDIRACVEALKELTGELP